MDSDINMINIFKYCYCLQKLSLNIVCVYVIDRIVDGLKAECLLFKLVLLIRLAEMKGELSGICQFSYTSITRYLQGYTVGYLQTQV